MKTVTAGNQKGTENIPSFMTLEYTYNNKHGH
jgi:hypothetical protein